MLEQFLKDCSLWKGPHTGASKKCEEEGVTQRNYYSLTAAPIPLHHLGQGDRGELGTKV